MCISEYVAKDVDKYVQFINTDEDLEYGSKLQRIICETLSIPEYH